MYPHLRQLSTLWGRHVLLAAGQCADAHQSVVVLQDMYQLLRPGVRILHGAQAEWPYSAEAFAQEYGLQPDHWVDVKALAGDGGDNIPGVKSIGQKTALQLVQQLGSVESILARCQEAQLPEKLQQVRHKAEWPVMNSDK
jgi:5'-3' exonuclease